MFGVWIEQISLYVPAFVNRLRTVPLERRQIGRVQAVKARRDSSAIEPALAALKTAAATDDENLMPHLLQAARVHATEGEIIQALQTVWGSYTETPVF